MAKKKKGKKAQSNQPLESAQPIVLPPTPKSTTPQPAVESVEPEPEHHLEPEPEPPVESIEQNPDQHTEASLSVERYPSPSVETTEDYLKKTAAEFFRSNRTYEEPPRDTPEIHDYNGEETIKEDWADGIDDKESQVHFHDSGFTDFSFEENERNTSEVLAADLTAGSVHSTDEGYVHVSPEEQILDFSLYDQLPRVNPDEDSSTAGPGIDGFDLERVIAAIQNGYSATDLQDYLSHYYEHDKALLRERLNAEVKGFPAIFFVVETNDADILRYWIKYGGDPNATHGPFRFPLLAFAILRCARPRLQAAKTVETLLRFGASAAVIPAAFYDPFDRDLPESGPDEQELQDTADDERLWCTPEIRPRLTAALSLTQRYRLWQASGVDQASGRERTLALRKGAEEILGLQQTVIGQRLATWSLRKTFLINLALPGRKPLVLLFAGPKGHGKSELTNQLAKILSLEPERVGRTSATHEEAFGTKVLDESTDAGSPLNDFLSRNTGHRSLVFIEEFEKASEQLYKELVIPFDRGEYTDRRNGQPIDCSQTIWILETSKFNDTVRGFFQLNNKHLKDSSIRSEHQTLRRQLSRDLRGECVASFGAPLSSRITEIIPFSTFDASEQAVMVDRCIMELENAIAAPIVKSDNPDEDQLIGNVQLEITNNAGVCSAIASEYYLPELGARSFAHGIDATITNPLISQYLEEGDDFSEDQAEIKFKVGTNEENEIVVAPLSTTEGTNGYLEHGYSY